MKLLSTTILCTGILIAGAAHAADKVTVSIATGGGSTQEGGRAVLWGPASEKLGYAYIDDTIDEGLNAVRLQVGANNVTYDIVQMAAYEAGLGGKEGILTPIDYSVVNAKDLIPGTAPKYAVCFYSYSLTFAYNTKTYGDKGPQNWADFFDVEKFPGRRAMRGNAEAQLEAALMADGVAPTDVYKVLATPAGLQRAIDKIEKLKPNIAVWWKSGAQITQLIKDGEVDMLSGWNGRFDTAIKGGAAAKYDFNQGVLGTDCFAVPKGAPHAEEAMKMLNEMMSAESQAKFVEFTHDGPTNMKAFETGLIDPALAATLPTSPDNVKKQIVQDADWWVENNDKAQSMFVDMMTR
ncbi:ABC transporter substrate-binding protein [Mesorhizobium sp. B2-4-15]|uniref:ABC transporter substrate-binding protein n=1 Tax=Mesorhizobium sp. B2-4-15 TaxID=2589934 RepID=UPI0011522C07|nr:ABC transporter substrate-binding protein [Mesorhizobium sp. B2-4-15]TPK73609.1 ABC transporter substrate-binding protein [Mesorhizobium sp. B2-4-15]